MRRPDLVRKLVLIGTAVDINGGKPWVQAMTEQMTPEHLPPMLIDEYAALSPDGRRADAEVHAGTDGVSSLTARAVFFDVHTTASA